MNKFWNWIKNEQTDEDELRLEGYIAEESWWDDDVTPKMFRAELSKYAGKPVTVWINSMGGDVFAASQIYTMLMEHKALVTVKIDGVAISAASVIAMAGGTVKMSPTAIMMIHNPWSLAIGDAEDMKHMANVLNEVKETIMNAYQIKTGLSRQKLSRLMDEETWMNARKALEDKFIDEILYTDTGSHAAPAASYAYSRMAVYNTLREKIQQKNEPAPAEPVKEEPRQVPLDLYAKLYENLERRSKL